MADCLGDPMFGLRSAIKGIHDPPLSLVLILTGTNDISAHALSHLGRKSGGGGECDDDEDNDVVGAISAVVDPTICLHWACHKVGREGSNGGRGRAGERVAGGKQPCLQDARRRQ
jgi:hypothetical protein